MKKKNVSIIILNYNDYKTTKEIIENIKNYEDLNHIIIVDNNSSDGSYDKLIKYKNNKIDIIKNDKNGGYAQGNNFGAKYAIKKYHSDYLIISNPDVIFENEIINKMINEFEKDKNLGIVSPKITPTAISYYEYNYFECLCSMFLIITKLKKIHSKEKYGITNFFSGSFFMIESKLFEQVGGFDENTFLYCEEIILNKKINKFGRYSKIFKDFSYIHNHSVTVNKVYNNIMKPYKIYIKSLKYYLNQYLGMNIIKKIIFYLLFAISYVERYIYNIFKKLKSKL